GLQLLHRPLMDLAQPRPALFVERSGADLLEQLADHAADPHDLGGLFHHLDKRALALLITAFADRHAIGPDHDHPALRHRVLAWCSGRTVSLVSHGPSLSPPATRSCPGPAGRGGPFSIRGVADCAFRNAVT